MLYVNGAPKTPRLSSNLLMLLGPRGRRNVMVRWFEARVHVEVDESTRHHDDELMPGLVSQTAMIHKVLTK
jgi:hypothetical protein